MGLKTFHLKELWGKRSKCHLACLSPRVHEGRMAGNRLESEAKLRS